MTWGTASLSSGDCFGARSLSRPCAASGEHGEPRWAKDPTYQTFEACTAGSYDRALVDASTNVTIVGTISGKTYIGMGGGGAIGPVVRIEKPYRWSDCIEGDAGDICKHGLLSPNRAPVTYQSQASNPRMAMEGYPSMPAGKRLRIAHNVTVEAL